MNQSKPITLPGTFNGDIIEPGDSRYPQAAATFIVKGTPKVIFRPKDTASIITAMHYATENHMIMSVRSGGHNTAGFGTNNGGVVIDLSAMKQIEVIDEDRHLVRVQVGATWEEVATYLQDHGLGLSSGDTKSVGVGGLTLGGGIGWMVRSQGLTIDNLVRAEVITADQEIIYASATEHPDLFWALRGGGGNFGIVTQFEFTAYPMGKVWFGSLQYSLDNLTALLKHWRDYMANADENLTSSVVVNPVRGDQPATAYVFCCYAKDDEKAVAEALQPLRQFGTPLKDDISARNYPEILQDTPKVPPGLDVFTDSGFLQECTDELIQTIAAQYTADGKGPALDLRGLGGAVQRVNADATAFAYRDAKMLLVARTFAPSDASDQAKQQGRRPWKELSAYTSGNYVNFSSSTDINTTSFYPPDTYQRLKEVKRRYDPENLFSQNYNIKL